MNQTSPQLLPASDTRPAGTAGPAGNARPDGTTGPDSTAGPAGTTGPALPPPVQRPPGLAGRLDFNPLSPFLAIMPLTVVAASSLNLRIPAIIAGLAALCALAVQPRRAAVIVPVVAVACTILTFGLAMAVDATASSSAPVSLGPLRLTEGQVHTGAQLGLRLAAVIYLVITTGLLAAPTQIVIASVTHLRVPLRIAGAALAALSFAKVLRSQHRAIRQAHLLRGTKLDMPIVGAAARWVGAAPALVAAAVRHAERVSMSMDARSFGAHPRRTEFYTPTWRTRDTLLVIALWAAGALAIHLAWRHGFSLFPELSR